MHITIEQTTTAAALLVSIKSAEQGIHHRYTMNERGDEAFLIASVLIYLIEWRQSGGTNLVVNEAVETDIHKACAAIASTATRLFGERSKRTPSLPPLGMGIVDKIGEQKFTPK